MTKAHTPTENPKCNVTTHKRHQKFQLHNDCGPTGRSVRVKTAIQLVWLNQFTGSKLPTNHKSWVIKRAHIKNFVNNPAYLDRGPTANHWGDAIKRITQTRKVHKNSISKIYKDIHQSRLCSACLEASSDPRTKEVPTNNKRERTRIRALFPLRRFGHVPLYSPRRLVSQSTML